MKSSGTILSIALVLLFSGQIVAQNAKKETKPEMKVEKAICVLEPTQGNSVTGVITFTKTDGGIKVVGNLEGLHQGKHGFHIHEFGDCSAPDGTSAGGHFNPDNEPHGAPMATMRHEGDMGNIEADASGKAHLEYIDKNLSFSGAHSILGHAVIIHQNEDDLKTQPTGNAGARVACGVIGISK
ncbi:MAG TPA: superoxide dismutase family protein [Cyclobacteriaceae bacterium]|nr:superoxide dismutase family protein [Cyclobacteriaceae bacterium]